MFKSINLQEILSAFIVLLAIIDIIGSIPIIISLKSTGRTVSATKATLYSFGLMLAFFYAGNWILKLFGVDIASFAAAGSILIFFMSLEMILDVEIFKNNGPIKEATLVPLVFPLLAGAGSFTTLLSLRAMYSDINILIALTLNMVWVFIVISLTDKVKNLLGQGGIYFIRKFFGIILLAIAVKLFTENFAKLL
jgi:multiple antibiotic resistance protein